jgi:P2 family phage contractile tail tube protein
MKIGNKVINYSVFGKIDGNKKDIGETTSLQLPSLESLTDTIKGAGIIGEIDWPTLSQIGSMTFAATFRNVTDKAIKLYIPQLQEIEVRWVIDKYDSNNNTIGIEAHKVFIKGLPKKLDIGKVEVNSSQEASLELETIYYNHIIDGVSVIEVDKLNYVLKIGGQDYARQIREALR